MPGWATRKTAEEIRRLVRLGKAREGGQLPSERDLANALQVSRATVRAALRILRDEGEIETRSGRGSGTFVSKSNPYWCLYSRAEDAAARPAVPHPMGIPQGVDESIALGGRETESTVLEARRVRADDDIARCLELPEGSDVLQLRRLRKADGEGIVLECAYLPCEKFQGILEKDLTQSLYGLMKGEFGVKITRISEVLEVVLASGADAEALGVIDGAPLMKSASTAFDESGKPIEHSRDLYRADRIKFIVENDFE